MFRRVTFKKGSKEVDDEDTDPVLLKKNVILKENQKVESEYTVGEYLGSGKFGEVKRCIDKHTGTAFAGKFVPIASKTDREAVLNEIAIMNRLRHPRLIQLCDAYSYRDEMILIVELITGGELFERIIDESFDLNESRCIRFMREILQGVEYIHAQHVLHLDLKPENILCLSNTSFKIKIIDFGLARFHDGNDLCVLFGTPEFVAPEVISYDPVTSAADMWSVGVICYVMLSGLSPFMGDNDGETLANIMRVKYDFDYAEFDEISKDARKFIRNLLVKTPSKRMSATECLDDPWIKGKKKLKRKGTVSKKRLKHFVYRRKWQKAVNAIIALQRMGCVLRHPSDETINRSSQTSLNKPSETTQGQSVSTASLPTKVTPKSTTPVTRTKVDSPKLKNEKKDRKLTFGFRRPTLKLFTDRGNSSPEPKGPTSPKLKSTKKDSTTQKPKQISLSRATEADACSAKGSENLKPIGRTEEQAKITKDSYEAFRIDTTKSGRTPLIADNSAAFNVRPTHPDTGIKLKSTSSSIGDGSASHVRTTKQTIAPSGRNRKVAPSIGGISSKIGFFSNLSDEPDSRKVKKS